MNDPESNKSAHLFVETSEEMPLDAGAVWAAMNESGVSVFAASVSHQSVFEGSAVDTEVSEDQQISAEEGDANG